MVDNSSLAELKHVILLIFTVAFLFNATYLVEKVSLIMYLFTPFLANES